MNLISANQPLTMSSREIATLLNKNHSDIKRSAKRLSDAGILTKPLAESEFMHRGNAYTEYLLEKRDCFVLVAQNSPEFTAAIVDRWQELENKSQPSWVAQLSQEAKIAIQDLSNQLTVANGEVERLQGVCNTITAQFAAGTTAPVFCKQLNGVNTQQVNNALVKMGMLQQTKRGLEPTSYARDRYFKVSFFTYEKPDGSEGHKAETTLTMVGAKWLYRAYLSNKLPTKKSWDGNLVHVEFEAHAE